MLSPAMRKAAIACRLRIFYRPRADYADKDKLQNHQSSLDVKQVKMGKARGNITIPKPRTGSVNLQSWRVYA
jgi:hypothetical protein